MSSMWQDVVDDHVQTPPMNMNTRHSAHPEFAEVELSLSYGEHDLHSFQEVSFDMMNKSNGASRDSSSGGERTHPRVVPNAQTLSHDQQRGYESSSTSSFPKHFNPSVTGSPAGAMKDVELSPTKPTDAAFSSVNEYPPMNDGIFLSSDINSNVSSNIVNVAPIATPQYQSQKFQTPLSSTRASAGGTPTNTPQAQQTNITPSLSVYGATARFQKPGSQNKGWLDGIHDKAARFFLDPPTPQQTLAMIGTQSSQSCQDTPSAVGGLGFGATENTYNTTLNSPSTPSGSNETSETGGGGWSSWLGGSASTPSNLPNSTSEKKGGWLDGLHNRAAQFFLDSPSPKQTLAMIGSTVPSSTAINSIPAPTGGVSIPPPMGGVSIPPPMGGVSVPPPMGGVSIPPPMGGVSVPPEISVAPNRTGEAGTNYAVASPAAINKTHQNNHTSALPASSLMHPPASLSIQRPPTSSTPVRPPPSHNPQAAAASTISPEVRASILIQRAAMPFNSSDPKHETLLLRFWQLVYPSTPLSNRMSPQWMLLGFQGSDPATDFRAGGILSLDNLSYFAVNRRQDFLKLLSKNSSSPSPLQSLPVAIVGINLTVALCEILGVKGAGGVATGPSATPSGYLIRLMNGAPKGSPDALIMFHELYCCSFLSLERQWRTLGADVGEFKRVFESVKMQVVDMFLQSDGVITIDHLRGTLK